ncbi:protein C1orf43 homolog [Nematostella vectensis]|uniref:protein C1orf43 homolog n=1 Tax=Nematostella vectensis TaxID=45351 RepID=UPI0020775ABF|nr:protein C1orf43 homolog [Nematostella vectensis]
MDDKVTEPVSDTDAVLLKKFGGVGLVMTIVFTIAIGLMIVIIVKRQILRMILISRRGPHTSIGADAPRPLTRQIENQLKRISHLRIEPRMMSEQFNRPADESSFDSPPDQYSRSYKYRMKAMDKMGELDDLICSVSHKYNRRKSQPVRSYLKMLQQQQVIKKGDDTIDKLADMYEHARFEPKEFGNIQYKKFAYLVEQLKDRVRLYVNVPGSLIINSSNKQPKKKKLSSAKIPSSDIKTTKKPNTIGPPPSTIMDPGEGPSTQETDPGIQTEPKITGEADVDSIDKAVA